MSDFAANVSVDSPTRDHCACAHVSFDRADIAADAVNKANKRNLSKQLEMFVLESHISSERRDAIAGDHFLAYMSTVGKIAPAATRKRGAHPGDFTMNDVWVRVLARRRSRDWKRKRHLNGATVDEGRCALGPELLKTKVRFVKPFQTLTHERLMQYKDNWKGLDVLLPQSENNPNAPERRACNNCVQKLMYDNLYKHWAEYEPPRLAMPMDELATSNTQGTEEEEEEEEETPQATHTHKLRKRAAPSTQRSSGKEQARPVQRASAPAAAFSSSSAGSSHYHHAMQPIATVGGGEQAHSSRCSDNRHPPGTPCPHPRPVAVADLPTPTTPHARLPAASPSTIGYE